MAAVQKSQGGAPLPAKLAGLMREAKWLALTGDERGLIEQANMHQAGRQLDPTRVRQDLLRLSRWERSRAAAERLTASPRPGDR